MRAVDIIRKKRDAGELSREEVAFMVRGAASGSVGDDQLAAWLMAVVWRGMSAGELRALTEEMLHSGEVLDFSDLPARKVDKHSTGGVGDKTSLVIAPVVAAAGLYVPMVSGRGLGHTGGTLDKLESIPGFNVNLSVPEFRRVLKKCGCGLIGQTPEIAPADKKLYALRDITATVESPYLICASIMSKKLTEGIDALILDVKTGDGAFMKKEEDAVYLAELMVETGQRMGKKVVALITDMEQPLGRNVGNALEVVECVEVLEGGGPEDLRELCVELAGWMLVSGERVGSLAEGRKLAAELMSDGSALEKFSEVIELQGGDPRIVDEPSRLPQAMEQADVAAREGGVVASIACEKVGMASMLLGGGRAKITDKIDPAVGLMLHKKVGDAVEKGERLCTIYYKSEGRLAEAKRLLEESFVVGEKAEKRPLIHRVIDRAGDRASDEKGSKAAS
jgi:pyrimidine-nucleoside phosphorylase/thymidine phosphorylase